MSLGIRLKSLVQRLAGAPGPDAGIDEERAWAGSAQSQPGPRLADPVLDSSLREHGYAVIEGFLESGEVEELAALFHGEASPVHDQPFASSIRSEDPGYKLRVSHGIGRVFGPRIEQHLHGYRYCFAGFLVKAPGGGGEGDGTVPLHQDIAMMNEAEYQGLGIWVPLVDTNAENGCLCVVPGSQKLSAKLRWPGSHFAFNAIRQELTEKLVQVPLKAGSAIVYCQKLIHFSAPNRTAETRIVAGALAAPKDAPLLYYHEDQAAGLLEVFVVDDDFYVSHTYGDRPEGAAQIARIRKPD